MGWATCGKNGTTGQLMGYAYPRKCHKRGCGEEIDRGLAYVCGGMHEGGELGCGYYFCEEHHSNVATEPCGLTVLLCDKCYAALDLDED